MNERPVQVRGAMERCISNMHQDVESGNSTSGDALMERALVPPAAYARICATALSLLTTLLMIFHNVCKLYEKVAAKGEALVSARRLNGRVMKGLVRRDGGFAGSLQDEAATVKALADAAAGDRDTVWGLLQKEVVALFAYIIRYTRHTTSGAIYCALCPSTAQQESFRLLEGDGPQPCKKSIESSVYNQITLCCCCRAPYTQSSVAQPSSADGRADIQSGSQWLTSLLRSPDLSSLTGMAKSNKTRPSAVTFRFTSATATDTRESGAGGATVLATVPDSRDGPTLREYRELADAALWRLSTPSPFLVACVYTPASHFVLEASTVLSLSRGLSSTAGTHHFYFLQSTLCCYDSMASPFQFRRACSTNVPQLRPSHALMHVYLRICCHASICDIHMYTLHSIGAYDEAADIVAGTGVASRSVLQHFLDDFVSESLLPRVLADVKALTQSIISQKSAFLPSSHLVPDGGGAFVLQVLHYWS